MDGGLPCRPWRLLLTPRPWRALAYLVLQLIAGLVTWFTIATVVLFSLWARVWARAERRLVVLAGAPPSREPRPTGGGVSWREIAHSLVTAALAPVGLGLGGLLGLILTSTLLAPPPLRLAVGPHVAASWTAAQQTVAVVAGVALAPVLLWG